MNPPISRSVSGRLAVVLLTALCCRSLSAVGLSLSETSQLPASQLTKLEEIESHPLLGDDGPKETSVGAGEPARAHPKTDKELVLPYESKVAVPVSHHTATPGSLYLYPAAQVIAMTRARNAPSSPLLPAKREERDKREEREARWRERNKWMQRRRWEEEAMRRRRYRPRYRYRATHWRDDDRYQPRKRHWRKRRTKQRTPTPLSPTDDDLIPSVPSSPSSPPPSPSSPPPSPASPPPSPSSPPPSPASSSLTSLPDSPRPPWNSFPTSTSLPDIPASRSPPPSTGHLPPVVRKGRRLLPPRIRYVSPSPEPRDQGWEQPSFTLYAAIRHHGYTPYLHERGGGGNCFFASVAPGLRAAAVVAQDFETYTHSDLRYIVATGIVGYDAAAGRSPPMWEFTKFLDKLYEMAQNEDAGVWDDAWSPTELYDDVMRIARRDPAYSAVDIEPIARDVFYNFLDRRHWGSDIDANILEQKIHTKILIFNEKGEIECRLSDPPRRQSYMPRRVVLIYYHGQHYRQMGLVRNGETQIWTVFHEEHVPQWIEAMHLEQCLQTIF